MKLVNYITLNRQTLNASQENVFNVEVFIDHCSPLPNLKFWLLHWT